MSLCIELIGIVRRGVVSISFLFAVQAQILIADDLTVNFERILIQGAMVVGHTNADTLSIGGRDVVVQPNGRFVFGLGRDAAPQMSVILSSTVSGEQSLYTAFEFPVQQRHYDIQKIEGVESKYVSPPDDVLARINLEAQQVKAVRRTNSALWHYAKPFSWPALGPVSGVYGSQRVFNGVPKRPHYGLDIAGPKGTPVNAPAAGTVLLVADMYYSGGTLIIDHGHGISSTFIHLNAIHVKEGDQVEQGERIADIGASGRVTGPHLDWRLNWFETRLDPQLLLPEQ